MKAAIYLGKESIEIREVDIPNVGDNDVLIKNIYSSICGTDVAVYKYGENTGHKIALGEEFGHETVSRVVEVGKKVKDFKVGDRVYPYPLYAKDDVSRAGTIGGFSEYILIPNARKNHSLYFVDSSIDDKIACLIEPFTIGCRAARRAKPHKFNNFVVFGCGTIGIAVAVSLKYFGANKVMICDISDFRLNIANQLGFEVCNTATENFKEISKDYFCEEHSLNGVTADIDAFVDACGDESVLNTFMDMGKIGSRFVAVAVNNSIRKLDLLHMTYAQKSIIGSGGYMPEDVRDVMQIMKSKKWDIQKIITHKFKLDNLSQALKLAGNADRALNVIIEF